MMAIPQEGNPKHWLTAYDPGAPRRVYLCGQCYRTHGTDMEAVECCQPEVYVEWECPICNQLHATKEAAEDCCANARAEAIDKLCCCPSCRRHHQLNSPNIDAIRIAGMCTYCSPHLFTREQKDQIEAEYQKRTGMTINLDEG